MPEKALGLRKECCFIFLSWSGNYKNPTTAILAVCKKVTKGMERGVWEAPPLYTFPQIDKMQGGEGRAM